jgi:23S rRNA (cytosine1962-C5)-methyltransferase
LDLPALPGGDICASGLQDYELLDSGGLAKLERIAGVLVQRPSPQALWQSTWSPSRWAEARSICRRSRDGGGSWEHQGAEPRGMRMAWQGPVGPALQFQLRLTAFGHCGVFPEQAPVWSQLQEWVAAFVAATGRAPRVANTFAYTGCGSLALAAAGAEVFHVDSAKGVLDWGKASLAGGPKLPGSVRWIHDDVRSFLAFGARRGFRYDAIIADPPSWGHGKKKETWTLDSDLAGFLHEAAALVDPEHGLLHCGCHSPGVQRDALRTCVAQAMPGAYVVAGEMGIAHADPDDSRILPAGIYACAQWGQAT